MNYNKLRLDVLEDLISQRGIECRNNKTDMMRHLRLDDEGKYFIGHTVEKYKKEKFLVGINVGKDSHDLMVRIGKLVEKKEEKFSHYSFGRHYFITDTNPLETE